MKYVASVTLMTSMGTPRPLRLGGLRLALEGDWIPSVSDVQATVGFNGTKKEDLNKLPAIGRLRVTVGLPWRFSLTLSYLPPITINGVQPNLFSLALGRPFRLSRSLTVGTTIYGQVGAVSGDFTCPESAVQAGSDPQRNPFGCTAKSHDQTNLNYLGLELSASYRIERARDLEPYATLGVNYMDLAFQVGAEYADTIDRTRLKTQGATLSITGGLLYPITRRLDIAAEAFYSPLSVIRPQNTSLTVEGLLNVRALVAYRFF